MKEIYTIEDVSVGDYFASINEDGVIIKEGSFKVTSIWGDKMHGRGYRKREEYSIPFTISHFYDANHTSNRVLLTPKEFKKGFIGEDKRFNAKGLIQDTLKEFNIEFSRIRFRQKVLYRRGWEDVRGDKYPAEYIMALEVHGTQQEERTREEILNRNAFKRELAKRLSKEFFNSHALDIAWNTENYVTGR